MARNKSIYKIQFHNNGQLYELYAHEVTQSNMYAFIEVADIIFGERSNLLVDPSEEKLKAEFGQVKRTYVPIQAVIRIDEVEKEGINKILDSNLSGGKEGNVSAFPAPPFKPKTWECWLERSWIDEDLKNLVKDLLSLTAIIIAISFFPIWL